MAASTAAAANQPLEMNAVVNGGAGFDPSMWRDFFVVEERMRARAERLAGEVRRRMFAAGGGNGDGEGGVTMSVAEAATLVDTLERLGLDGHFRHEIGVLLGRLRREEADFAGSDDDLYTVALRFRLLRQHGVWVSAGTCVRDKFRDGTCSFSSSLRDDPRGLLSLYNAAHMAAPVEIALDDIIAFARCHLEALSMEGELKSPLAEQVSRAPDIPLPRFPRRLETMSYLVEYEQEDEHDDMLLELARLEFELTRCLHLEELKALSLWWRELYESVKLSYARDRLVESYFWTCGVFHEEEYSRARIMFAKVFGLLSLMDDTYDVHATLEECYKLNEAIQRWDEGAISILPEYLRMFYIKLLSNFDELEASLEPHEKFRVSYAKNAFKLSSEYYLREAKWSNTKYTPSFAEHLEVSVMSSGFPMLAPVVLMGVHDDAAVATAAAFEWATAAGVPDVVIAASGEVARFLNDIASHRVGKNEKDVPSSVESYMAEHGVGEEAALAAVAAMAEHGWRTINRALMEMDPGLLPAARLIVNLTRTLEVIYLGGRDGYTFGGDIKGLVVSLFLDPVAVIRI
uniref:Terpene synthase N-terminal domain-containing protein n=1 Tax=Oryza nivara TaxID=4536 RepID=A0A0E0GMM2_ORYNI